MSEENQEQEAIVPITVVPDFCHMYENIIRLFETKIAHPPSSDKDAQQRIFKCLEVLVSNQALIVRELAREETNDPTWGITADELQALAEKAEAEFADDSAEILERIYEANTAHNSDPHTELETFRDTVKRMRDSLTPKEREILDNHRFPEEITN